jgi:hypothetical protein
VYLHVQQVRLGKIGLKLHGERLKNDVLALSTISIVLIAALLAGCDGSNQSWIEWSNANLPDRIVCSYITITGREGRSSQ